MKWFVILALLTGTYYFCLMASADMVVGKTQQMQQQYVTMAQHVDQIAAGATSSNR